MNSRLTAVVLTVCCLLWHGTQIGTATEPAEQFEAFMDAPPYDQAHWGVLVAERDSGEVLYERQSGKLFVPASVTKLFTVAAALDSLGAEHRFKTPLYRRGDIDKQGTLAGDLILVASGDLTLSGRTCAGGEIAFTSSDHTYANWSDDSEVTAEDPLAGLNQLAQQAHAAGLRKFDGDVLVDDRIFRTIESTGSGPSKVQPVVLNDNVIDFVITPTEADKPASVICRPESKLIRVSGEVMTVRESSKPAITIRGSAGNYTVSGSIPAGRKPLVRHVEIESPPAFVRAMLLEALRRAGIETKIEPAFGAPGGSLPKSDDYAGLTKLAELESPPFAENARLVLKVSHNLHASTLPILVDLKNGGKGTLAGGLKHHRESFEMMGVDVDRISFAGGAGGARGDYVTPAATVQLLRGMTKHKEFAAYERALPILGVDGTLAKSVFADSPIRGKVQAKTGTLMWENTLNETSLLQSKALAGYMTAKSGKKLAFALFVNGVHLKEDVDTKRVGSDLAKLCELIYAAY
jgi:D-alanyl-D-alanine carboxypeptidase/D-alanyl-D-alanine-endopeptidase (penicillin-binding protein 4)